VVVFSLYVVISTTLNIAVQLWQNQTFGHLLTKAKEVTLHSFKKVFE